jgi:hypothetical protein
MILFLLFLPTTYSLSTSIEFFIYLFFWYGRVRSFGFWGRGERLLRVCFVFCFLSCCDIFCHAVISEFIWEFRGFLVSGGWRIGDGGWGWAGGLVMKMRF